MPSVPFATLLEARSAMALDLSEDGAEVLVASNLTGTMQLYRVPLTGGVPRPVTDLPEPVGAARYLPGSDDIVLSVDSGGNERHQLHLVARAGGPLRDLVADPDVMHVLGGVSRDGALLSYVCNRRNGVDFDVYVRELAGGAERCVMEGGHNRAADFSPDGRLLLVVRDGDLAMDSDIHLIDLAAGSTALLTGHEGAAAALWPSWYPDSRSFLFSFNDGRDFLCIARYSLDDGGWGYVLEPGWDALAKVSAGGERVLVAANDDGVTRLTLHHGRSLAPLGELPLPGQGVAVDSQWTPDPLLVPGGETAVITFTSPGSPAEVYRVAAVDQAPHRVTVSPSAIPAALRIEPELHRVVSFDGLEVPVFLYRPADAGRRPSPVVLLIHGGPEGQSVPAFNPLVLHLVDCGLAVALPNVRGSTGYGKAYGHLDDVRRRLDSVADLAAIHAWLPSAGLDPARTALIGGSYGGYMTLAGLAFHPELWAAGVSIVGISSLLTFLENTSPYRRAVREREYGSLARDRDFLIAASPLTHAGRIRAPLMLIHGANDPRVPVSEAEQLHRSLSSRGVPCDLIVYSDEGHGLARLANRLDAYPRVAEFLVARLDPGS